MEVFSFLLIVLISLILLIVWYIKRAFSYWESMGVPHDPPEIPYGNVRGLGKTSNFYYITQQLYNKYKGASKICGMYIFMQADAVIMDLDLVKDILVKEFATFGSRNFYYNEKDEPLSAHLVAIDGEKWKHIRTKLTPTFTSGKMKYMFPTITKVGDRLVEYMHGAIRENTANNEFEMKNILARFTIDVIGTVAFGIECDTLKEVDNEFYRLSRMAMEKPRIVPPFSLLLRMNSTIKEIARYLGVKSIQEEVHSFFMNVVKDTIDYREKNNIERNDFMDLLIKIKTDGKGFELTDGLTVDQIAAQAFLFFLAGYETSSTTMLFTLYELALNPHIQTKLRTEIDQAKKRHGNELTYEMMMDIPYLDQVINESLRKYPPFTILGRQAQKDYKIPDTDIVIRKGSGVMIPIYAIQRDPEYFPDPEKFDPDRFTPKEVEKRHPMAWLPFGFGPRNCIGLRFGMMQARIGIILLLSNFKFLPCSKTQIPIVYGASPIVLGPKDGIHLKVEPINPSTIS